MDFLSDYFDISKVNETLPGAHPPDRRPGAAARHVEGTSASRARKNWLPGGSGSVRPTTTPLSTTGSITRSPDAEIDFVVENILVIADPKLFKIITHG